MWRFMNLNSTWNKVITRWIFVDLWSFFCLYVLRKVRENRIIKIHAVCINRCEHTKFVLILKWNTVPCRIFKGISFWNVVINIARCGNFRYYLSSWNVTFQNNSTCFVLVIGMHHFSRFLFFNKFPATCAFDICVEYYKTKQTPSNKIW